MVGNVSLGGVTCGRVDYVDHPERQGLSGVSLCTLFHLSQTPTMVDY